MSEQITVTLHEVVTDGLPNMDELVGRVAFIFDGCIISGWPLEREDPSEGQLWEGNSDVSHMRLFGGVKQWVEFDRPVWQLGS